MKLGIVGAENSHCAAIAKLLNQEKVARGFSVTHVWGETRAFAKAAAEAGDIPTIVEEPTDMIGEVDCVMVDHRHGGRHIEAARPFVEAGIPVFVDKPLSTSLGEAKRFLKLRREKGVPVTTMSIIPLQPVVKDIKKKLKKIGQPKAVTFAGPGEYKSKYGGITFYGIHQVDLMIELFGTEARKVVVNINGDSCQAVIDYPDELTVTINFVPGLRPFQVCAIGTDDAFHENVVYEGNPYLAGTKTFTKMFRTGKEPFDDRRMLAPVAVLEAMQKSIDEKRWVKVGKF
ncbi:MAG: Gfo/Idh/MocA family protein [Planctomycetota bacterium]